jgi:hypothetical protein
MDVLLVIVTTAALVYVVEATIVAIVMAFVVRGPDRGRKLRDLQERMGMGTAAMIFGWPVLCAKGCHQMIRDFRA